MTPQDAAGRKVLVVDDDAGLLHTLTDVLELRGFDALTARTGREGIAVARSLAEPLPVALVDLRLPDMDGLEVIEGLHRLSRLTEVVVLTGHASVESAINALRGRSFDYLVKPVPPGDLVRTLEAARARWHRNVIDEVVRRERARQGAILEACPVGVLILDMAGRVEYLNRPAELVLGLGPRDGVGSDARRWLAAAEPLDRAAGSLVEVHRDVAATGDHVTTRRYALERGPGQRRVISVSAAPLRREDGSTVSVVMSLADVTERWHLEEAVRRSQKMEAVGRLAASVAHDFNNVLTVIMVTTEALLLDLPPEQGFHRELGDILEAARQGRALTRQLLGFSRRETGVPRALDVNAEIDRMEGTLARILGPAHTLLVELDPLTPPVRMPPDLLRQALVNLCTNARDAMIEPGTVTVRTLALSAPSAGVGEGAWAVLEVRDTGHGMDSATLSRVFEPFFTTKDEGEGTGLGLATVYGAVTQVGGSVDVWSEPERGSVFRLLLPAAVGEAPAAPDESGPSTALVVLDDEEERALVRRTLVRRGHTVLEAVHGREALDLARRTDPGVDLVIASSPGKGRPVASAVADLGWACPRAAILLLGGDDAVAPSLSPDLAARCLGVPRPVEESELLDALARAVRRTGVS